MSDDGDSTSFWDNMEAYTHYMISFNNAQESMNGGKSEDEDDAFDNFGDEDDDDLSLDDDEEDADKAAAVENPKPATVKEVEQAKEEWYKPDNNTEQEQYGCGEAAFALFVVFTLLALLLLLICYFG